MSKAVTLAVAPAGQGGWRRPSPASFVQKALSAARVSDDVACQVVNREGSLISHADVAGDLPGPWILRQMEKYLAASGSRFLCKIPWFREFLLSAPFCPQLGPVLQGVSGVRGPICCLSLRRAENLCCKTQAGVGDSVTRSLRNAFCTGPPGPLLTLSVTRPAVPGA